MKLVSVSKRFMEKNIVFKNKLICEIEVSVSENKYFMDVNMDNVVSTITYDFE